MDGDGAQQGELIHIEQVKTIRDYVLTTLYVDFDHPLERGDFQPWRSVVSITGMHSLSQP